MTFVCKQEVQNLNNFRHNVPNEQLNDENPLRLRNSKNVPLYLLCFAVGNPKGAPTAVNIAEDILLKELAQHSN